MPTVPVEVDELSHPQILRAILLEVLELRKNMADLSTAVADLQAAVQRVLGLVPTIEELKAANAVAVQALADFQTADAVEDADYQAQAGVLQAALQAQVDASQAAADAIEGAVADLNTVAAPAAPVEEPVVEEPVAEVPVEEPVVEPVVEEPVAELEAAPAE